MVPWNPQKRDLETRGRLAAAAREHWTFVRRKFQVNAGIAAMILRGD
jgi:hypothetical protein